MVSEKLLPLLKKVLGDAKVYRGNKEVAFHCPFCNHHKKKLQVNLESGHWHCWVCQTTNQSAGKSIYSLFKRLGVSPEKFSELNTILGDDYFSNYPKEKSEQNPLLYLPKDFISLDIPTPSPEYKRAMAYLKSRGVKYDDVVKYGIGYAEVGEYKNKIIIPSYDRNGKLNFFSSRTFVDDAIRFKNPPWSKNIVGFELFINWNLPIVLVEGAFDAIAVRFNAIPLFGKTIPDLLMKRIVENNVRDIYICLDDDALLNSIKYAEIFMANGIRTYVVRLPHDLTDKNDPSKLGFMKMHTIIRNTEPISSATLIKLKLNYGVTE